MRQAQRLAPWQRRSAQPLPAVTEAPRRLLTPRRATWLVLRPTTQDHHQLAQLTAQSPELAEAVALAQDFAALVRQRQPAQLEPWLTRAAQSTLPPFRRFARGLRADLTAVQAAVTLPWSHEHMAYCTSSPASWPVEGTDPPAPTAWRDRLRGDEYTSTPIIIACSHNPAAVIPAPHGLFAHAQVR